MSSITFYYNRLHYLVRPKWKMSASAFWTKRPNAATPHFSITSLEGEVRIPFSQLVSFSAGVPLTGASLDEISISHAPHMAGSGDFGLAITGLMLSFVSKPRPPHSSGFAPMVNGPESGVRSSVKGGRFITYFRFVCGEIVTNHGGL